MALQEQLHYQHVGSIEFIMAFRVWRLLGLGLCRLYRFQDLESALTLLKE